MMVLWHGGKVELGGGGGGHKNIVLFPPLHSVVSLFGMSSKGVSQIDTMTICTSVLMRHLIYHNAMETEKLAKKAFTARPYPPTH